MPNFGDIGRELAKEINEEPEVEIETEEERKKYSHFLFSSAKNDAYENSLF